jgi:hypothetical protein
MNDLRTLELSIKVTYDLSDVVDKESTMNDLRRILEVIPSTVFGRVCLTDDSEATVDSWTCKVEEEAP